MSTLMFVDPEISTQADGALSSRVPVPLPEDPYEAIRTARMTVRVLPAMSLGLSSSMAEVIVMSDSMFCKRFRSSYESSPSSSPLDLPSWKRYQGTSELVEDDEEIEESFGSDSVSEDAEDESPTVEDKDPTTGDEGIAVRDEGLGMGVKSRGSDDESYGLDDGGHSIESNKLGLGEEEEAVPEGQQRAVLVMGAAMSTPLGLRYETDPEDGIVYIDVLAYPPPVPPAQTSPLPEWSSGSLPISPAPSVVPSPISSPMVPLTVPSPVASPATAETEGCLTELGAQVKMQGGLIRDHTVIEERHARLEWAEIVDSMRRGQEPRGYV
ncbi:hypothetical protein Tco_0927427 [Tanacetum coccineum]